MQRQISMLIIACALCSIQCTDKGEEEKPQPTTQKLRGSWSPYYPNLFHDGEPFESANFIIYSDKSSAEWREEMAGIAEEYLLDIMTNFDIDTGDLDFVATQSNRKIHVLTNFNQWGVAVAYRDGVIMRSKDGIYFTGDHATWQKVFQHEITHVIEFLLIGEFDYRQSNSVWMREGFGNYGARNHRIQTLGQLNDWREKMRTIQGQGNPIGIRTWSDFPQSVISGGTTGEYYGFFELAVRYLVDEENGNGTNITNLKDYFEELGTGVNRNVAFERNFGISMNQFEVEFWTLMETYLDN